MLLQATSTNRPYAFSLELTILLLLATLGGTQVKSKLNQNRMVRDVSSNEQLNDTEARMGTATTNYEDKDYLSAEEPIMSGWVMVLIIGAVLVGLLLFLQILLLTRNCICYGILPSFCEQCCWENRFPH